VNTAIGTRKRLADLGAVASGLAHEIRNPLNSLYINSQLLAEMIQALPESVGAQRDEMLSLARTDMKVTQRLNDLLTEFLRFARPAAKELVVADLNRIVTDTLRFLEVDFGRRGVVLTVRLHPGPLPLFADDKQLKQALMNVLLNAEESMEKAPPRISVDTGIRRGRPWVRVADNGRGIPAADRRQIFKLFFTTRRSGSGLGLPIVRQIVRDHGGRITVRSREGVGTAITFSLPSEEAFKTRTSHAAGKTLLPERVR
jgi:two-component system sensor histidine kinase PilS (NtrC family)